MLRWRLVTTSPVLVNELQPSLVSVNQPTFISCVGDGADKLIAFQSNF